MNKHLIALITLGLLAECKGYDINATRTDQCKEFVLSMRRGRQSCPYIGQTIEMIKAPMPNNLSTNDNGDWEEKVVFICHCPKR